MGYHYGKSDMENPYRRPKPKGIREVPSYVRGVTYDFFKRLFYMYGLVWDASPWMLFLMFFMAIFNGVTPVIGAKIRAELLNSLADAYLGSTAFYAVLSILVTLFIFNFVVNLVNTVSRLIRKISNDTMSHYIKLMIMNKAKTIDLASFDMPEFYAKLDNANREAGSRPMDILNSSFSLISTLISMTSFIVMLWDVNPYAPLIIMVFAIPSAVLNFVFRAKNVDFIRQKTIDRREMNYYGGLVTSRQMVKELKLFDLSDLFIERFDTVYRKYYKGQKRLIIHENMWNILMTVLRTAVNCLLYLYIAKQVCDGILQVGDYSLYTGALHSIGSGVSSFIATTATIYEGTLFIENMISFMEEEPHIRPLLSEPRKPEHGVSHKLELRDVSFRYPGTEKDVISHLNLVIRPGEKLVLVGLNGAGKTTLIKLITRLYDPTEGEILLDGRDIREYDVKELYSIFGIIFQDFGKYASDVAENIRYGRFDRSSSKAGAKAGAAQAQNENSAMAPKAAAHAPERSEGAAIRRAAEQSNAADFIERLPDGYATPLTRVFNENGVDLSGGQWQKLAIARAFYADADFLILDEPTSALDPMAEQEIYNEFGKLSEGKTTIFVSHRLSSATTASKIVVLEYGELIEEGTHAELMEKRGRYYELFTTQAQRYVSAISN